MNQAIQIIQADMRTFFAAGFSIHHYRIDHVISALHCAGLDTLTLHVSPQNLLLEALLANALQKGA